MDILNILEPTRLYSLIIGLFRCILSSNELLNLVMAIGYRPLLYISIILVTMQNISYQFILVKIYFYILYQKKYLKTQEFPRRTIPKILSVDYG